MPAPVESVFNGWLADYQNANSELLRDDPGFATWLKTDYLPIAGGWQY